MRIVYTIARLVFGAWFLFSGLEYFLPGLGLQPLGKTALAQEFTLAMIHSGLFVWIKLIEIIIGLLALINRGILPAALACAPLTVVIAYWNFVLDPGVIEYSFGLLTTVCNTILIWPHRERLLPLLLWKADPL
jgi:hypothetical protein